jgi:hypothetical protein
MHRRSVTLFILVALVVAAVPAFGGHAWGTYHWKRTSTAALNLPIHDNVTSQWDSYLVAANSDWNTSTIFNNTLVNAPLSSARKCASATGKIEVCNASYGQNGWLGIAGISLSGGHIIKGYTKLNDTYFSMAQYNAPKWRAMVTCQEIGHDFGLGHVNENFNDPNTGSCMDYSNDPGRNDGAGDNTRPNAHDYSMLESIYNHIEPSAMGAFDELTADATRPKSTLEIMADADQWGTPIAFDGNGRPNVFRLVVTPNHGGAPHADEEIVTHVFWAPDDPFAKEDRTHTGKNQ